MNVTHSQTALMAENRRLREQLAALREEKQAPISVDPSRGRVTITDYQTDQFKIDKLSAQSEGIKEVAQALSQVDQWVGSKTGSLPDLSPSLRSRVQVDALKISVPFETVNKAIPKIAGPQLKEAGVRSLRVGPGEKPNEVSIQGRAKKIFEVGFSAVGEMSVTPTGESKFVLKETRVGGLPMPNFLSTLATQIFAGESMREIGVTQNGSEFTMDPSKMMPSNVDMDLTDLRVDQTGFVIEGGQLERGSQNSLKSVVPQEKEAPSAWDLSAWNHAPMMV